MPLAAMATRSMGLTRLGGLKAKSFRLGLAKISTTSRRRTSFSSTPSCLASCILLMPASRIATNSAAFAIVSAGGATRCSRRFAFLGRYQLTKTYEVEGQAADPNALRDSVLSEINLSGSYDRRDNFADPARGFFTLVGASTASVPIMVSRRSTSPKTA